MEAEAGRARFGVDQAFLDAVGEMNSCGTIDKGKARGAFLLNGEMHICHGGVCTGAAGYISCDVQPVVEAALYRGRICTYHSKIDKQAGPTFYTGMAVQIQGEPFVIAGRELRLIGIKKPADFPVGQTFVCWWNIVRIKAHGYRMDSYSPLPNCLVFDYIGMRRLDGAWWRVDFNRTELKEGQADVRYFEKWDGNGILFGTEKAKQLVALRDEKARLQEEQAPFAQQKQWDQYHTFTPRLEAIEQALEALCESPAQSI